MITVKQIHRVGRVVWEVHGVDLPTLGRLLTALQGSNVRGLDCVTDIGRRAMGAQKDETNESVAARVLSLAESLSRT